MGKNCSQVYNACTFLQPCQNNATCSTTPPQQDYSCTCVSGFTGSNCETNIDDCVHHTCQAFEQCYDRINNYTCACPIGEDCAFLQCCFTSTETTLTVRDDGEPRTATSTSTQLLSSEDYASVIQVMNGETYHNGRLYECDSDYEW